MRLQGDRVHASESLLLKDSADIGRHIGKLSPAEIRNTRLQDLHATKAVQLSAHNTCNVHSWLPLSKQSCFYCVDDLISLIVFLASLLLEGMLPPANRELFDFLLLKYTLCSVVTDVTQHRHRDY